MNKDEIIASLEKMFYEVANSKECEGYGVSDTEPRAVYRSILWRAINGESWESCKEYAGDWEIYTSVAGWKTCVRKLNSMAKKAHGIAQKNAAFIEEQDIEWCV